MKVRLLFFASLRERLGTTGEEVDVPPTVSTVGGLRDHLRERGGAWAEVFAPTRNVRAALNQDMAQPGAKLKAGDEIAFFPPVTGG
jgi:molybdopterin synthase sulfur carrier subunit